MPLSKRSTDKWLSDGEFWNTGIMTGLGLFQCIGQINLFLFVWRNSIRYNVGCFIIKFPKMTMGGNFQQQYKVKHSSKQRFYTKNRNFYIVFSRVYWDSPCLLIEGRHPSEGMKNVCWTNVSSHITTQIKKHIISTRNTSESCSDILFM